MSRYGSSIISVLTRLHDIVLLLFFFYFSVFTYLLDAQLVIGGLVPYPAALKDLLSRYADHCDDYLIKEGPLFLRGLLAGEMVFVWPLSIAGFYAGIQGKSWFRDVCLTTGVYVGTSMAAVLAELLGSGRASYVLLMVYLPWPVFSVLAVLKYLITCPDSNNGSRAAAYPQLAAARANGKKMA